jgi:hypothetical protein
MQQIHQRCVGSADACRSLVIWLFLHLGAAASSSKQQQAAASSSKQQQAAAATSQQCSALE